MRRFLLLFPLLFSGFVCAENSDVARVSMESLAQTAIEQSVEAIAKNGSIYPFALMKSTEGKLSLVSYQGEQGKLPPADDYAKYLFRVVGKALADNPTLDTAVIVRQSEIETEAQGTLPGVWLLVDHRAADNALVLFQPFVPDQQSGQLSLGRIIVQSYENRIFTRGDSSAAQVEEDE